jgi:glutathione synthase/RimK-type ligase-like ATP-grasp enzyme
MNQHHGGRDIRVCLNRADAERALRDGFGFFTIYVLKQTEYRVWIYRRRHLGTYEKRLEYREKFKRIGGNYANGYAFHLVSSDQVPRAAVELSTRAITALSLDFGAVDVLNDKSGASFVLEVNTAPGVEGDGRTVIQALAVKIANWEKRGYPRRNGDKDD